jgi:methylenetetrahydrofolate dehydrogenase (NADP+)/methenyltetrahydrofolate cyclohydrolase
MNTRLITGKELAAALNAGTTAAASQLPFIPHLAAVCVGGDPAAKFYAGSQERSARKLGLRYSLLELASTVSTAELDAKLSTLSADPDVHGLILLTPLPSGLSVQRARQAIAPAKDVEGVTPEAMGRLALGLPAPVAPTARSAYLLAKAAMGDLAGVEALVAGYSDTVGKPLTYLLLNDKATVTAVRSKVNDLPSLLERADLVLACIGKAHIIRGEQLRPGAVVIDVGTNEVHIPQPDGSVKTAWVGDVDTGSAMGIASAITPVPGGVGTLTTAVLFANLVEAARVQAGK